MPSKSPKDGKLLYHLPSINNLENIFDRGLLSRKKLESDSFKDIADRDIISHRQSCGLDEYVPFHFFAGTPF